MAECKFRLPGVAEGLGHDCPGSQGTHRSDGCVVLTGIVVTRLDVCQNSSHSVLTMGVFDDR